MEIIQILVIIFALFAFSRSILRVKDKEITLPEFAFWSAIWLGVMIIALLPEVMELLSRPLGIGRGVDIIIYISIILLFYLVFRIYVKAEINRQEITKLVREVAKSRPIHRTKREK
ncbi:MAG: DUF2304 family protein [Nanoarchaeota archaeon]